MNDYTTYYAYGFVLSNNGKIGKAVEISNPDKGKLKERLNELLHTGEIDATKKLSEIKGACICIETLCGKRDARGVFVCNTDDSQDIFIGNLSKKEKKLLTDYRGRKLKLQEN